MTTLDPRLLHARSTDLRRYPAGTVLTQAPNSGPALLWVTEGWMTFACEGPTHPLFDGGGAQIYMAGDPVIPRGPDGSQPGYRIEAVSDLTLIPICNDHWRAMRLAVPEVIRQVVVFRQMIVQEALVRNRILKGAPVLSRTALLLIEIAHRARRLGRDVERDLVLPLGAAVVGASLDVPAAEAGRALDFLVDEAILSRNAAGVLRILDPGRLARLAGLASAPTAPVDLAFFAH